MSDTKTAEAGKEKAKGGKGKMLAALATVLLVACGAGGGTWFFMQRSAHAAPAHEKPEPPKKPLFSALEPFTVNLQEPRGDRFAQIGVTLQFEDPEIEVAIKDRLPALRNNILMLLASKRVDDLLTPQGKQELAVEIQARSNDALGFQAPAHGASAPKGAASAPVRGVLFSQFIVQ